MQIAQIQPFGCLPTSVFACLVSVTDLAHVYQYDVSSVRHFSVLSTSIHQEMFSHAYIPDASNEFGPRFVAPAVKLAISGFPHIVPTFPVTVQVRPASSMFRRWFFLDHQLVLRFNRVVATPITQGWSCSCLDYRKRSRGVSTLMTKSCRHGVHRFFVPVGYIHFALDGKQTKC